MPCHRPTLPSAQIAWVLFEYPRVHCLEIPSPPPLCGTHIPLAIADTFLQLQYIRRCVSGGCFCSFLAISCKGTASNTGPYLKKVCQVCGRRREGGK